MMQWQPIPSYPGYEASDEGQIRGAKPRRDGIARRPQIICPWRTSHRRDAVLAVHVYDTEGKRRCRPVAHLVLSAFGVAPPSAFGCTVVPVDGNSQNLRLGNLRWQRSRRFRQAGQRVAA